MNATSDNKIKYFSPVCCPECKKIFYLVIKAIGPEIAETITLDHLEELKEKASAIALRISDEGARNEMLENIKTAVISEEDLAEMDKNII